LIASLVVLCRFFLFESIFTLKTKNIYHIFYNGYILSILFSFLRIFYRQKEKIQKNVLTLPFFHWPRSLAGLYFSFRERQTMQPSCFWQ